FKKDVKDRTSHPELLGEYSFESTQEVKLFQPYPQELPM
ncbi:hypothetical protein DBR06_SOUSAS910044, partial [Sousa chinensis]